MRGWTKADVDALWGRGVFQRANRGASAYSYTGSKRGNPWGRYVIVFYNTFDEVEDWTIQR